VLGGINNGLFLISFSGFLVVGVMAVILKWAFSGNKSVIEKDKRIGHEDEYGLLRVAHSPKNTKGVDCMPGSTLCSSSYSSCNM